MELAINIDVAGCGGAFGETRDAKRVVIAHQHLEAILPVFVGGLAAGGNRLHEGLIGAEDASRLTRFRIKLNFSRLASRGFCVTSDVVSLEGQSVQRGVGPGGEDDGVIGGGFVELGAGWVALLFEARDENLAQADPVAFGYDLRPIVDMREDVFDRRHGGDLVIELEHRGIEGVSMAVDKARDDSCAIEIDDASLRAFAFKDRSGSADGGDAISFDGHCRVDREARVHSNNLAVVDDEVGLLSQQEEQLEREHCREYMMSAC